MAKSLTKEENILLTLINAFQNDEKEKLNHLVNISKSLIEVRKKVKEEMEKLPPQFNVFNSINLLNHENYNSNLFTNFLEIKFKYNGNEIGFAKLFLKYLNEEFGWEFDLENIKIEDIEIKRELPTEERKRIDIFIGYKEKFAIIIENKIWADDGYKQLENYYNYVKSQKYDKIYMIYLTPYEREPSEESLSKELYKEKGSKLYGKFANIRHAEIGYWLEGILKRQEFYFLNNEEENNKYNYKLLKSALIQIIDNEKSISGENEEGDLTETEIKKVLKENLFKELEAKGELTESELDKYFEMFDKAKSLLVKEKITIIIKKYLKFTKEINKYIKAKGYKEGKDYTLLTDEEIINKTKAGADAHHIDFIKDNIKLSLENNSNIEYYYGISYNGKDKKTINKIKNIIQTIKKYMNIDKFTYEYEHEEGDIYWIFWHYIEIEKDKPQEIAEVMIKLYKLLKKEIK
ncbi:PD-(D/E)XK nuclease family protein [Brachyspira aalborgi]|uniref:PD-(D/E)XK nuclease family protein n=1 Tax=Brachyspira aalborgi TaxID=29522 RepID=A0A5C8FVA2_9SPIR|nr:PD-(D/E)XK nuclease family protein [Brachyspira aalborgi]TXJ53557.1 hypothetical protein EPJ76_11545 [Brachyspira aalborgi]